MSIISISGKMGAGKDTVAAMIQYLIWKNKVNKGQNTSLHLSFEDFQRTTIGTNVTGWKIKKFANKLKDITCMLLNCTREQLEDREFKEKELGEEWRCWKVFNHDPDNYIDVLYASKEEAEYSITSDGENWFFYNPTIETIKLTPRLFMQLLGTNCGRMILHPNIWCNSLMAEYKAKDVGPVFSKEYYPDSNEKDIVVEYPNWIISDTRFPNELKAIKDRNGITIKIVRPDFVENALTGEKFPVKVHKKEHESETALDNCKFDYEILNDGTIADLRDKVEAILKQEQIIS